MISNKTHIFRYEQVKFQSNSKYNQLIKKTKDKNEF